jgi:hypothetical protein
MDIKVNSDTAEFVSWLKAIEALDVKEMTRMGSVSQIHKFKADFGARYVRISRDNSAHAFIDRTNGDVLMPATWRSPAKHARGNIFDATNGMKNMKWTGPAYMNEI